MRNGFLEKSIGVDVNALNRFYTRHFFYLSAFVKLFAFFGFPPHLSFALENKRTKRKKQEDKTKREWHNDFDKYCQK